MDPVGSNPTSHSTSIPAPTGWGSNKGLLFGTLVASGHVNWPEIKVKQCSR